MNRDRKLKEQLVKNLHREGRSIKWFWMTYILKKHDIGYSGFSSQLNGYAPITAGIRKEIETYLKG